MSLNSWPLRMSSTKLLWSEGSSLGTKYGHYFDRLLEKKNILVSKEEELLAGAGEIFAAGGGKPLKSWTMQILFSPTVHDDKGEEVQLTHGNYISLVESKDRAVRKAAYEGLYKVYEQLPTYLC